MTVVILLLGVIAGLLTTFAGAGGGVLLILSLSMLLGPHVALAASAPALLIGNLHRLSIYRRRIDVSVALPVVAGALPGSLLGGALAVALPEAALRALFLAIAAYSIARAFGAAAWRPSRTFLAPAGLVVGGISGSSGGAGLLMSPLLLSVGLSGESYVATSSAIAVAAHTGRLVAYGARGYLSREVLAFAALTTVAIVTGNFLGDRARHLIEDKKHVAMIEYGVLALSCALAVAGLARHAH